MEICYSSATSKDELGQILELQKKNLPTIISKNEKEKEGFVTVSHTLELLEGMNIVCPHTIAMDGNKVVGYALSMHPKFGDKIDVLKPMFTQINAIIPENETYIVMGQICIDKAYRKKGIFRNLYKTMKNNFIPKFDSIITEVDASNIRSLNAHYAVGFKDLKTYSSDGRIWNLIVLK